jgi:hypothetical protein
MFVGGHYTFVELTDERYVYCVVDNTVGDYYTAVYTVL